MTYCANTMSQYVKTAQIMPHTSFTNQILIPSSWWVLWLSLPRISEDEPSSGKGVLTRSTMSPATAVTGRRKGAGERTQAATVGGSRTADQVMQMH